MNKDFKRRVACEAIIFLALMALMFFITRLWLFIFLTVILLFIFVIRLLFLKATPAVTKPALSPTEPEKPDTEQDILRRAYGLLQRRVTEYLTALYPDARWVWSKPNAMALIAQGEPVYILLNRAGGYLRAEVLISSLQFKALNFETAASDHPQRRQL